MKSCEFSQIKFDYCLKSNNSLKIDDTKKYHLKAKFSKSQSHSLNDA